jgi:hypothetical protein
MNAQPVGDSRLGLVDGSVPATSSRFFCVLDEDAVVQLDDLVCASQTLPDGREVTHFGIVVEESGSIEGAEWASDTQRIAEQTMPGQPIRRAEVQILRTVPELWLAPRSGAEIRAAQGVEREQALFADQMSDRLPVGLDQSGQPIWADFSFMNGEKGGHVSITGISGVATKTSYATFLLYQLFETEQGRRLMGQQAPNARALVFNVKGEDLMHLDRPNRRFATDLDAQAGWRSIGVENPGHFESVRLYAPRSRAAQQQATVADIQSRPHAEVRVYGWTPLEFIREGLLRFCFTDDEDRRTQVGFVEQRVRVQLARHCYPLEDGSGAVVIDDPPPATSYNFERIAIAGRPTRATGEGQAVLRDFSDLVDFLMTVCDPVSGEPDWQAGVQQGTLAAFVRRMLALQPRMGHLVATGAERVSLDEHVTVVDIHTLHDAAQRFVVGALLDAVFASKQGSGREPLRFVVLDELNKYAPRQGQSPLKELLVDIAERGRSLGVLLIGAQQSALDIDAAIFRNAALKVAGRLDASEASEYRFLSPELRERAARFLPGTMVLDQPLIPAPIPLRFPFPSFATNVAEAGEADPVAAAAATEDAFERAAGGVVD